MFLKQCFHAFDSADVSVDAVTNMPGIGAELFHSENDIKSLFLGDCTRLDQAVRVVAAKQENRKTTHGIRGARYVRYDVSRESTPDRLGAEGISGAFDLGVGVFEGEEGHQLISPRPEPGI
jgi:hypothetical protein